MPAWLDEGLLLGCRLLFVSSPGGRARELSGSSLIRALIPLVRAPPS